MKTSMLLIAIGMLVLVGCETDRPTEPTSSLPLSKATTRSLQEFLDAQGTYCIDDGSGGCYLFVPPVLNFFGWTDPHLMRAASVDYAGHADKWLKTVSGGTESFGTTFSGTVTERVLDDGRALISVNLHTKNALVWVIDGWDFGNGPLLFGWRAPDVYYDDKPAALGECFLQLDFTLPEPGDPLPDMMKLGFDPDPGMEIRSIGVRAHADGTLRALAGVAEGTPGRAEVTQTAPMQSRSKSPTWDGFPAENIKLHVTGR